MPASFYDINPSPRGGQGPYGMVPGPIGMPDPYGDLSKAFPALPAANKLAGTDVLAELGGNITPGTRNALQLAAAQRGSGGGMPLSGLSERDLFGNIVGFSEGQVKQGMQDYNSLVPTISKTQTVDPALQTEIANRNATYAAAPDPTQANNLAQRLFDEYLNRMKGPGGGTGGGAGPASGTGIFSPKGGEFQASLGAPMRRPTTATGSSPYDPNADLSYNPLTGRAGGGTGLFGLLPDYTNPFGIGNVGDGTTLGGIGSTTPGANDQSSGGAGPPVFAPFGPGYGPEFHSYLDSLSPQGYDDYFNRQINTPDAFLPGQGARADDYLLGDEFNSAPANTLRSGDSAIFDPFMGLGSF